MTLILASGSPRRRELLELMGVAFEVYPATVTEWEASDACPRELVAHNAALKADWVLERRENLPILASDTTVALGDEVLNKPADLTEARAMLKRLSGREHMVYTAVSLRWKARSVVADFVETSTVRFRALDDDTITRYFERVNPLDKAGAYGIQEGRELIIESWEGSLHNIMGLPTERLSQEFERLDWWAVIRVG